MVARNEFESWESKKLKIFQQFKIITDHREIVIDERRDRDTDRILKMGVGKSRLDQLQLKDPSKQSSRGVQMLSASEFTS